MLVQRGRGKLAETATNITNKKLRPSILSRRCATTRRRAGHCHLDNLLYLGVRRDPPGGRRPTPVLLISNMVIHELIRSLGLR